MMPRMLDKFAVRQVLSEVEEERQRQYDKHGDPLLAAEYWLGVLMEELGEVAKAVLERREQGEHNYRDELLSVSATAAAAIQCYDRVGMKGPYVPGEDQA